MDKVHPVTSGSRNSLRIPIRQDISPLRYPGGKRKLVPLLANLLANTETQVELLCEPFAGGAAVSIGLLEAGIVNSIAIADKDPLIASFWQTVFSSSASRLADRVLNTEVTLEEWRRQKTLSTRRRGDLAFKCLFLSRTSFSGCLTDATGPIGGMRQTGDYDISCRFNQSKIADRIIELSKLRHRVVFVRCQNWKLTLSQVSSRRACRIAPHSVLFYLDPPFFAKAPSLYREYFDDASHAALASSISTMRANYVLSYDDHFNACQLYGENTGFARVNLQYNARIDDRRRLVASEILVSNLISKLRKQNTLGSLGCVIPLPHRRKRTVLHQRQRLLEQELATAI